MKRSNGGEIERRRDGVMLILSASYTCSNALPPACASSVTTALRPAKERKGSEQMRSEAETMMRDDAYP